MTTAMRRAAPLVVFATLTLACQRVIVPGTVWASEATQYLVDGHCEKAKVRLERVEDPAREPLWYMLHAQVSQQCYSQFGEAQYRVDGLHQADEGAAKFPNEPNLAVFRAGLLRAFGESARADDTEASARELAEKQLRGGTKSEQAAARQALANLGSRSHK